jgi:hypothetical protein
MMADLTRQQQQLMWGVEWLFRASILRGALGNLNFGYLRTGGTVYELWGRRQAIVLTARAHPVHKERVAASSFC